MKHWNILKSLGLVILVALINVVSTPTLVKAAPFTCEPAFYQTTTGTLKKLNPVSGAYETLGSTALYLNAVGYNTEDNYIYGLNNAPGAPTLMRIDNDGTFTDLGAVSGIPTSGSVMGDFDPNGNLFVATTTTLYKIDVSAISATSVSLSASISGVNDLAYINGHLYGTNGTSLFDITVSDGTVTTHSLGLTSSVYGAAWSTASSKLYFSRNDTGVIYEVTNYTTNSPVATAVLQGEGGLIGNDGASCSTATSVIIDLQANDDSYTTSYNQPLNIPANTGVLNNDVGPTLEVTSYTQPPHGVVTLNPDGSFTYTPNKGYTGQDTFTYTVTDSLGNTATATVTLTVAPQAPAAGNGKRTIGMQMLVITAPGLALLTFVIRKKLFS